MVHFPCSTSLDNTAVAYPAAALVSLPARTRLPFRTIPCAHSAQQTSRNTCCGAQPSCSSANSCSSAFITGQCEASRLQQSRAGSRRMQAGCKQVQCATSETVSPRLWRHRWRYMRSESARTTLGLPKADWHRYHLQVMAGLAEDRSWKQLSAAELRAMCHHCLEFTLPGICVHSDPPTRQNYHYLWQQQSRQQRQHVGVKMSCP